MRLINSRAVHISLTVAVSMASREEIDRIQHYIRQCVSLDWVFGGCLSYMDRANTFSIDAIISQDTKISIPSEKV